jgi:hypothetical protein
MAKEALRPHAEHLVRADFVVLAIDWRTAVFTATVGVAPRETDAASGLLNSSRQIGVSLGLAALVTFAERPTSRAEQADDHLLPGIDRQSRNTITVLHPVPGDAADSY